MAEFSKDGLELTQEEKQLIWDALYNYQKQLHELSRSHHFAADVFSKQYDICVNLMTEKLDKYWDIIH